MKNFKGYCKNCHYGILKINGQIRCKIDDKLRNPKSKCKIEIEKKIFVKEKN